MIVLEEREDHAESTRYLVITKILNLLGGFVDTPGSVQVVKSGHVLSWSIWNWDTGTAYVEERILLLDCDVQRPKPPRGWNLAWPSWPSSTHWDMVSSTSVEQSHAVTSSIEETHASKPQEQSSLMKYPSDEFIQIDKRKWNAIPACDTVDTYPLEWEISKRWTALVQHRDIDNREIGGAVHWSSLFPMLRRDFDREGVRTLSDSQWLGHVHRGSNKPRFQFCVDSGGRLLYVRAIQGHSGGELTAPELVNHVAIPLRGRKINFTNSKNFVGWSESRRTVARVSFDLPECKELKKVKEKWKIKKIKERKRKRKMPPRVFFDLRRRLKNCFSSKNVTRNRAAIEANKIQILSTWEKKKKKKGKKNLNPQGRQRKHGH